jgi:membrane protein DedA with SNARE-associated domain
MSAGPVIVFGGISAALWNALLMGLGYAVGNNWDVLRDLAERYAAATLILIVLAVIAGVGRFLWEGRRA